MVLNTLTDSCSRKTQFPSSCPQKKKASSDLQCTIVEIVGLTYCCVHFVAKYVSLEYQVRPICQ